MQLSKNNASEYYTTESNETNVDGDITFSEESLSQQLRGITKGIEFTNFESEGEAEEKISQIQEQNHSLMNDGNFPIDNNILSGFIKFLEGLESRFNTMEDDENISIAYALNPFHRNLEYFNETISKKNLIYENLKQDFKMKTQTDSHQDEENKQVQTENVSLLFQDNLYESSNPSSESEVKKYFELPVDPTVHRDCISWWWSHENHFSKFI